MAGVRTLYLLAAVVWYTGAFLLLVKGFSLLSVADQLEPSRGWPWRAAVLGSVVGALKGQLIFTGSCRRNLRRISALRRPRICQFYSPRFFGALALMVTAGVWLSNLSRFNYFLLNGVAMLDLSIGIALLWSSRVFWTKERLGGSNGGRDGD